MSFLFERCQEAVTVEETARRYGSIQIDREDKDWLGLRLHDDAAGLAEYRGSLEQRVSAEARTLQPIEDADDSMTGQQHQSREVTK